MRIYDRSVERAATGSRFSPIGVEVCCGVFAVEAGVDGDLVDAGVPGSESVPPFFAAFFFLRRSDACTWQEYSVVNVVWGVAC